MTKELVRFRRFALVVAAATLLLTTLGTLVRATGSGLGCLDEWPRCAGGWIAPLEYHALIEYSHRAVAALVVVLVLASIPAARSWARSSPKILTLSIAGFAVVIGQALLGMVVVRSGLHGALVSAHFTLALALVAITTWIAAEARALSLGRQRALASDARMARLGLGALLGLLPLLAVGAYVREKGAGLAFGDWPLMGGRFVPSFGGPGSALQFTHRLLALLVAAHLVGLALRARRESRRDVRTLAFVGAGLFAAQAMLGAANVWTRLHPAAVVGHGSLAFITWSTFVLLTVTAAYGPAARVESQPQPAAWRRAVSYVALTKPRIVVLLLITTIPAMVVAAKGMPSVRLMAATLFGGMLTAGSANALNQYLERDIDEKMKRTRSRPLPSHSVGPRSALVFALVVGVAGFVWLAVVVNLLSAMLAAGAILFYVLVYTLLLKRSTPQNIVIGGAAGAVPVLVGWAAVTGTIGAPAWVMFTIIFLWTPPHFWALAMRYRDDYAAAGVPMLPVVRGERSTTAQIVGYSLVLVAVTLLLSPVGGLGALYALTASALGGGFIYRAVRLRWEPNGESALKLFRYSVSYLGLLFAAIAVDRLFW
jgi:protoheme IX farnesyltransferase